MKKAELCQAQLSYARQRQDIDETPLEAIFDWIVEVERVHEMLRLLVEAISGHPQGRFDMLQALFLHPDGILRPADLATVAGMTRASTSHNLDVLEREGLIHRKTDPKDRRSAMVNLTEKGRDLMAKVIPTYLKAIESLAQKSTPILAKNAVQRLKKHNANIEALTNSFRKKRITKKT